MIMALDQGQAAVVAAIVAGAATLAVGAAGLALQASSSRKETQQARSVEQQQRTEDRKQRDSQLFTTAVSYFDGKSQRRAVGIAMIDVLRASHKRTVYDDPVCQLYYSQARYLLVHGSNRWEGHEIGNAEDMIRFLLENWSSRLKTATARRDLLMCDLERYLDDSKEFEEWMAGVERDPGGTPNIDAIRHFRTFLEDAKNQLVALTHDG